MDIFPFVLAVLLPFMGLALLLFRTIARNLSRGGIGLLGSILLFWAGLVALPFCIFAALVPTLNYLFRTFPFLQAAAWDVGLAIALSVGLLLTYVVAAIVGAIATWKFMSLRKLQIETAT